MKTMVVIGSIMVMTLFYVAGFGTAICVVDDRDSFTIPGSSKTFRRVRQSDSLVVMLEPVQAEAHARGEHCACAALNYLQGLFCMGRTEEAAKALRREVERIAAESALQGEDHGE